MLIRDSKATRNLFRAVVTGNQDLLDEVMSSLKEGDRIGQIEPHKAHLSVFNNQLAVLPDGGVSDQTAFFKDRIAASLDGEYSWNDDQVWRKIQP